MIIRNEGPSFHPGYTSITGTEGSYAEWLLDFGILVLDSGQSHVSEDRDKERTFLLLEGDVEFFWEDETGSSSVKAVRKNVLEVDPVVLHVGRGCRVRIASYKDGSELALTGVNNDADFKPRLWKPGEYRTERFGEGTLQDTSTRLVRTFFDAATAGHSQMVLGEVINFPGKWSSYPPHDHGQPEIYHYRFFPAQGYGHAEMEDEILKVKNGDTYAIPPGVTHSQCAAPGYAMYYIWMIPHLPGDRFGPDSRVFRKEHTWVMNPKAPIWPDASLDEVLEARMIQDKEVIC